MVKINWLLGTRFLIYLVLVGFNTLFVITQGELVQFFALISPLSVFIFTSKFTKRTKAVSFYPVGIVLIELAIVSLHRWAIGITTQVALGWLAAMELVLGIVLGLNKH